MVVAIRQQPTSRRRALVVDDSKIARNVLSGALLKLGFDVETAHSAESALGRLTGPLPEVVFMDHLLPGIDGLDAVRELRGQPRTAKLPIVMYTSQESEAFLKLASAAGANDVFPKSAENTVLENILQRLNLAPARHRFAADRSPVVPLRGAPKPAARQPARGRKLTRADLLKLLEPSLAAHHDQLHQDLLTEFAILERYEERMRRDLFARVDALTRNANEHVDRAFALRQRERERERRGGHRRRWAIAAALALAFGLSMMASWNAGEHSNAVELQGAVLLSKLDSYAKEVEDLSTRLSEYGAVDFATEWSPQPQPAAAEIDSPQMPQLPSAAAALVGELQAMGILGPVRVETTAGSFCVSSTPDGYRIEVSNLALEDCETLPLHLTAANW